MKAPKWFTLGIGLVVLNFVAVTATVLSQQGPPALSQQGPPAQDPPALDVGNEPTESKDLPELQSQVTDLNSVKPPEIESLPQPALPVPQIELPRHPPVNDPVYEGIREMVSEGMKSSFEVSPTSEERAFNSMKLEEMRLRIEAVQSLNQAVLLLLEEAQLHAGNGREGTAKRVVETADSLRAQAAKLLSPK